MSRISYQHQATSLMKSKILFPALLLLVMMFSQVIPVVAQDNDTLTHPILRNWRIDVHAGAMFYYGDLIDMRVIPYPRDWRLAYGISLGKELTRNWALRGNFIYGEYAGSRKLNGIHYQMESSIMETSLQTTYDVSSLLRAPDIDYSYRIYGILGAGLLNYDAAYYTNGNGPFSDAATPGKAVEGSVSMGLGLDIDLSEKWRLAMESTYHAANSDFLDGYEGSSGKRDMLQYTSLGIGYRFDFKTYRSKPAMMAPKKTSTSWHKRKNAEVLQTATAETSAKPEIAIEKLSPTGNQVDVICWVPEQVNSNEEFLLTLEISKAGIKGRAEVKVLLPAGYTAPDQEIEGVVFISAGRNVTIHLTTLPDDSRIPVKFRVKPENAATGNHAIYLIGKISSENGRNYKFSTIANFRQIARL